MNNECVKKNIQKALSLFVDISNFELFKKNMQFSSQKKGFDQYF